MGRECRFCGWFRDSAVASGYGLCVHPGVRRRSGGKGIGTPRRDTDAACGAFCLRDTAEVQEKTQEVR